MDKNSVVIGETVILSTSSNQNVAGSITWNDNDTMTFTSNALVTSWCSFTPDCFFTFTIVGEDAGNGTVEDVFG
jgi:hypothetical protein